MSRYKKKTERPPLLTPWGRYKEFTTPTGMTVKLFGIASLASVIGRTPQTIRTWEIAGTIPPTPFYDVRGTGDHQIKNRLYTEEQIQLVAELVERHKLVQGYQIPRAFSQNVYDEWNKLGKKYFGDSYHVERPKRKEKR